MISEIKEQLQNHCALFGVIERDMAAEIAKLAQLMIDTLVAGGKLLVLGNGGSAADAQHFVAEIVGRFKMERKALPAIALSTDTSIITAIGNDYGFDSIFSRQIEALTTPLDLVVGISTSGNSLNVLNGFAAAGKIGCKRVALLGRDGGSIKSLCDLALVIPSDNTARIQEAHITIIHLVCDLTEKALFSRD